MRRLKSQSVFSKFPIALANAILLPTLFSYEVSLASSQYMVNEKVYGWAFCGDHEKTGPVRA